MASSSAIVRDRLDADRRPASISLILPAWNEAEALPRAIAEADAALRSITTCYEIIVIDDGSTDTTARSVEAIALGNPSVKLVHHETNRGYGAALRTGFAVAQYDLVVFTDADSQFDLRELDRFAMLAKDYDVVCGYRIDRKDSPLRCMYSRVYNLLVRLLLPVGVRDVDCALKMFRRKPLQACEITTNGFLVNSELLLQLRQAKRSIVEVGVSHRPRLEGSSSVSIRHIPIVLAGLIRLWWSRVLFPGAKRVAAKPLEVSGRKLGVAQAMFVLVAALMLFTGLSYPLIDRDETRYAEIPREMIVTGEWIVPQLNFVTYYDKPALLYWLCALSYSVFGIHEWAARLVPAACGLITLLTTMWFANRHWGRRVGLLSGIVMLISVGFLGGSRVLLIDGLLTCCVTVSLFAAYEAVSNARLHYRWWMLSSVACGLAFLAKGPIALVLLVPPVFAFCWLTTGATKPRLHDWSLMGAIIALIACPWFVAVTLESPGFATKFFYTHNVTRFAGAFHAQPIWYFIPVVLVAAHPWSFLSIGLVDYLFTSREDTRTLRTPLLGFLLLWAVWCVAFFSISKCKLPPYILPAMAPLSLVAAQYLDQVLFSRQQSWSLSQARHWAPWFATLTTCLAGIGFAVFALICELETTSVACAFIAFWTGIAVVAVVVKILSHNPLAGWGMSLATATVLAVLVTHRELPRFAESQSLFSGASPLLADVERLEEKPLLTLGHEWSAVPFETGRSDIRNLNQLDPLNLGQNVGKEQSLYIIAKRRQPFSEQVAELPDWAHAKVVCERGPARVIAIEVNHALARLPRTNSSKQR